MPTQELLQKIADLDQEIESKKAELALKIIPLVQEFTRDTGLLVRSIEPAYIDITTMDDPLRQFVASSATVHTDLTIRGISSRKMGADHA